MKYILVPISTVGCGKSTTFRILTSIHPDWAHVENDSCSSKNNFYHKLSDAINKTNVVLLDRNNQLRKQRAEITSKFAASNVCLIALEFVEAKLPKKELWDLTYDRMRRRGDNHQQIKSKSNVGMTKMIVSRFVKEYQPFNPENEEDLPYIHLQMTLGGQLSLENARRILQFLHSIDPGIVRGMPSEEALWSAYRQALAYQVPESEKSDSKRDRQGRDNKKSGEKDKSDNVAQRRKKPRKKANVQKGGTVKNDKMKDEKIDEKIDEKMDEKMDEKKDEKKEVKQVD